MDRAPGATRWRAAVQLRRCEEAAVRFERFVEESGLHEYCEQVNTRGQVMEMEGVVAAFLSPR